MSNTACWMKFYWPTERYLGKCSDNILPRSDVILKSGGGWYTILQAYTTFLWIALKSTYFIDLNCHCNSKLSKNIQLEKDINFCFLRKRTKTSVNLLHDCRRIFWNKDNILKRIHWSFTKSDGTAQYGRLSFLNVQKWFCAKSLVNRFHKNTFYVKYSKTYDQKLNLWSLKG